MKSVIRPFLLSAVLLSLLATASAQQQPFGGAAMSTAIPTKLPGYTWFGFSAIDEQWGYTDNYVTIGSIQPICTDRLEGWWFVDGRAHMTDRGNWFANLGLGRRVHFAEANADLSTSVWFDYDHDIPENYGHPFYQIGVSGYVRTSSCDIYINGYIPIGTTDYESGNDGFAGHQIVVPGLDNALEGMDAILRTRPGCLQMVGGRFDVGGYYYRSDVVDGFGGIHLGLGFDLPHGVQINLQYNNDSLYKTTGMLQFVWRFGGARHYSPTGRGLEPTVRKDHIVRRHRDEFVAANPATGLPWNVIHVENDHPGLNNGTAENPFTTLAAAEAASAANDMIFVWEGDGTTTGYDAGIALKAGQYFLGDGVLHEIPIIGGTTILPNNQDGNLPMITNAASPVVTLANGNVTRGFIVDGGGVLASAFVGNAIDGSTIDNNVIQNTTGPAIDFDNITGDVAVTSNTMTAVGTTGVDVDGTDTMLQVNSNNIAGATGNAVSVVNATGTVEVNNNTLTTPGGSGVFLNNATGATSVDGNTITTPGVDGITATNIGGTATFDDNTISNSPGEGILLNTVTGDISVSGNTITDSTLGAITILNSTATHTVSRNTITNTGLEGIIFTGTPGSTTLAQNVINDPGTDGISIDSATGTWDLSSNQIVRPGDNGLQITNSTADFNSSSLIINQPTNDGIFIDNSTGTFTFRSTTIDTAGDEAIAIENSTNSTYVFQNADIQNATAEGARFTNLTDADITLSNFNVTLSGNEGVLIEGTTGDVEITGSTITVNGQNVASAGVQITLAGAAGDTLNSTISGSAINGNATHGIAVDIDGPGGVSAPVVTTTIANNVSINRNGINGIDIDTDNGADHTINIFNNSTINENQFTGIAIRSDGFGAVTQVKATVDDNNLTGNNVSGFAGTAGILFNTTGDSNLVARLDGNTVANSADGTGVRFAYSVTSPTANIVRFTDNTINNMAGGSGLVFSATTDDSRVDFLGQRNTITNSAGSGLAVTTTNLADVDFDFHDGTITDSTGNNITVTTWDESRLDLSILRNNLLNSVLGQGAVITATNGNNTAGSTLNLNFTGNNVQNNNFGGTTLWVHFPPPGTTPGNPVFTAQVSSNTFAGNGFNDLLGEMYNDAGGGSVLDVTLTGNNAQLPYTFNNNSTMGGVINVLMNGGNTPVPPVTGGPGAVNVSP